MMAYKMVKKYNNVNVLHNYVQLRGHLCASSYFKLREILHAGPPRHTISDLRNNLFGGEQLLFLSEMSFLLLIPLQHFKL